MSAADGSATQGPGDGEVGKPGGQLVLARKPKIPLLVVGGMLLALFIAGVIYSLDEGSAKTVIMMPASPTQIQTTSTTTIKNAPSDALLTAVLATGAVLILVGYLYDRITSIKLPGGTEIGLSSDETKTARNQVTRRLEGQSRAPTARITSRSLEEMRREKARAGVIELPKEQIESVVDRVVEEET